MRKRKLVSLYLSVGAVLIVCLFLYSVIPSGRIHITSVYLARNFSPDDELLLKEQQISDLIDTLNECILWRALRMDFPKVSGSDCEFLMTGTVRGKNVGVQMIFTASGDAYFRMIGSYMIYTTYSSSVKDSISEILFG